MIPLAEPTLGGNAARYLQECVDSGYVSSVGPFVERFEREFAATVGARHAVACASGSAALHVALRLAGARPGRLVAVSDFTFIASANAVSYTGADLLLVDSEAATWNMDTELLHDEVLRRASMGDRIPDIVEIVHVLGHPADMEPVLSLRERFGIRIVEDAAEALGGYWISGDCAGHQVGTLGDLGCFSFNGNKIITTGGGGMVVTDDGELAGHVRHLTTQAKLPGTAYIHDTVGYNYRLSNLAAALGSAQLETLAEKVLAKRQIAERYSEGLRRLPVTLAPHAEWAQPTHWLYSLLIETDEIAVTDIASSLSNKGIEARRVWPPLHQQKPYASADRIRGAVAESLYQRGLSLPSSAHLTEGQQRKVIARLDALLR